MASSRVWAALCPTLQPSWLWLPDNSCVFQTADGIQQSVSCTQPYSAAKLSVASRQQLCASDGRWHTAECELRSALLCSQAECGFQTTAVCSTRQMAYSRVWAALSHTLHPGWVWFPDNSCVFQMASSRVWAVLRPTLEPSWVWLPDNSCVLQMADGV